MTIPNNKPVNIESDSRYFEIKTLMNNIKNKVNMLNNKVLENIKKINLILKK